MFQLSAFLSFHTYYMWLIVAVCFTAFVTAIVRLGNFRKDQMAGAKQLDSYVQLLAKFNQSTDEEREVGERFGINSPEMKAAHDKALSIWGELQKMGIQ